MNKAFALAPLLLPVPATAAPIAQPVIWDFFETGCSSLSRERPCGPSPSNPVIASLVISGDTSSGAASWDGNHNDAAQVSGDDFELFVQGISPIESPNFGAGFRCGGPGCGYALSWSITAGQLGFISFAYDSFSAQLTLGSNGGRIATDSVIGGCDFDQCSIAGNWADPPGAPLANPDAAVTAAPEPVVWGMWAMALGLLAWRHRQFPPPT